jgi:hypothetical protein
LSAPNDLRAALAVVDEQTLAVHLRVSVAALRRYASGELNMNLVIRTRLAGAPVAPLQPDVQPVSVASPERHRAARRRRPGQTPLSTRVVAL